MSSENDKPVEKPRGPFPHPAKYMNGDRSTTETDGHRNPARAPGHRPLERESEAGVKPGGEDASGPEKAAAPQQARDAIQHRH